MADSNRFIEYPYTPPQPLAQYQSRRLLGQQVRAGLESIAKSRRWRAGDVILRAGELAPFIVVMEQGNVRSWRTDCRGAEDLRRSLPDDALLGLASVIGRQPNRYTIAATESCVASVYDARMLRRLMTEDGQVALELAEMLALRVLWLEDAAQEAREAPLIARAYAELNRLRFTGQGRPVKGGYELRISQYDLACLIGSSRESVNPMLKRLQQAGALRLGYRTIVVLDSAAGENQPD